MDGDPRADGPSPDDARPAPGQDLMSADRRTMLIAAVAMVSLILAGVVSGALFASSACDDIAPRALTGDDVPVVAAAVDGGALAGVAGGAVDGFTDELAALEAVLGPLVGVADVPGATALASAVDGVATIGDGVALLASSGDTAVAAAAFDDATVVGDGPHLYSLALTNPLTGQVDALQPLDEELGGLTCVDTALIGSALAFHLDAGDGELLLLRIDEDGDDPELELRDPVAGRSWAADLVLPSAPAGLAGARLTAGLGPTAVVTGTRTLSGAAEPVLTAVSRDDGAARWTVDRDDLTAAGVELSESAPLRAEVAAVGTEVVLVGLREVTGDGPADEGAEQEVGATVRHQLLALDLGDGAVRWQVELDPMERVVAAELATTDPERDGGDDGAGIDGGSSGSDAEVVVDDAAAGQFRVLGVVGGELVERAVLPAEAGSDAVGDDDPDAAVGDARPAAAVTGVTADDHRLLAAGGTVMVLDARGERLLELSLPVVDVASHTGGTSLLLGGPDLDAVVVTFAG